MERQSQIGVFGQSLQAESASIIDRLPANGADRAWHDRDTVPTIVGAPIEIEPAGVLERLTTRDECS